MLHNSKVPVHLTDREMLPLYITATVDNNRHTLAVASEENGGNLDLLVALRELEIEFKPKPMAFPV